MGVSSHIITKSSPDKQICIMTEYPEIIIELTKKAKSDELRHFYLCSLMSGPSLWDSRNPWQQYYLGRDQNSRFYYVQGGSGSSGQRYNRGFYGHLFALLNSENPVPTCFFTYDSRNEFIFNRKEESLWLNSSHLVGNFQIDWKESERILKDVGRIERE